MYFRLYLEFTIIRINLKCGIKKNDYLDIYFYSNNNNNSYYNYNNRGNCYNFNYYFYGYIY